MNTRRRYRRRGVLLLVVLSLLVMFLLAGLTFVVVARNYSDGAQAFARHEATRDDPGKLLDMAMYQLVRGPSGSSSRLQGHSLLEDLYGNDGVRGLVTGARMDAGGQFFKLDFDSRTGEAFGRFAGHHSGAVLTMLTGPARGCSARVAGYSPSNFDGDGRVNSGTLLVEVFESGVAPATSDGFVVNGLPFNGTGSGYNPATGKLDLSDGAGHPVALLPNFSMRFEPQLQAPVNVGGADESWDAVDYQNMFMAWVPLDVNSSANVVIPSFHRPALINYWMSRPDWASADLRRRVILRPMPYPGEHPRFTGSNPAFRLFPNQAESKSALDAALLNGPWDVDNDGDGIPDSVWLDLGFPISAQSDGRTYKPLFAILCVDLDGRVNLNAHGNLAQTDPKFSSPVPTYSMTAGGESEVDYLSLGQGYGPSEVNLGEFFSTAEEYKQIVLGRYGRDKKPGIGGDDVLSRLKSVGVPFNYTDTSFLTAYADWPDVWGRRLTALDHTGHPLVAMPDLAEPAMIDGETVDDPYELNLVGPQGADSIYTAWEMEQLLRQFDADVGSPVGRLAKLLNDPTARRAVTAHSFDVPAPNTLPPPEQREFGIRPAGHILDLMAKRLADGGVAPAMIPQQLNSMLAFELRHGQKMDVNRLWGNGRDDRDVSSWDVVGVVDEPSEVGTNNETVFDDVSPVPANFVNDYPDAANQALARQIYARHLYCLMMLMVDPQFAGPVRQSNPLTPVQRRELTARRIAQWAVNVVDFRDADAIMTPFEYDVDPFNVNGWDIQIDADPTTVEPGDRRIVWGCEYPDLILTETLAFHDRRVRDTDLELAEPETEPQKRVKESGDEGEMAEEGDKDLDQIRIPQGSLFIELYCTRRRLHNNPVVPLELYTTFPGGDALLDLGRMAPPNRGQRHPVWRIAISSSHHNDFNNPPNLALTAWDATSFQPENMTLLQDVPPQPLNIERTIWFTAQPPTPQTVNRDRIFYNRFGGNVYLSAGRYAVVGPRPVTHVGSRRRDQAAADEPSSQTIELTPAGVSFRNISGATDYPAIETQIQRPLTIMAAADPPSGWKRPADTAPSGIGLSVSEPLPQRGYYPEPSDVSDPGLAPSAYQPPLDVPVDSDIDAAPVRPLLQDNVLSTRTTLDYKTAFLQRLANPLWPWNPSPGTSQHDPSVPVNPYVTVDWIPIDLTVFNGEDARPTNFPLEVFDPDDPDPLPENVMFQSRERGQLATNRTNLWSQSTVPPSTSNTPLAAGLYFPHGLRHTLGYLNSTYAANGHTVSASFPAPYVGDPPSPFPWLTWNNRPFVSHLELLLVPGASQGRLLHEFGVEVPRARPYDAGNSRNYRSPFRHLFNFFQTADVDAGLESKSAHLYRIFDYLEVPSRFVGTERWYNPSESGHFGDPSQLAAQTYRPPFNKLSRFRDPGRININTISDPRVWRAVNSGSTPWSTVMDSRRGYPAGGFNSDYPSQFANPFRTAASADLMPLVALERKGTEATLLRPHPQNRRKPLLAYDSNRPVDQSNLNPYFYYQTLQRLGNLVTTHSNVYAVWITVGFFEVQPHPVDEAHPDGYQLSQEVGMDTGNVTRHRAFYMIDRSVPVGFVAGQNHNVDRAVVLRRLIE
jgi:hypothetical protein